MLRLNKKRIQLHSSACGIQLSQHHLLKRLFLPPWMGLAPLSRISWPRTSLAIRWLRLCLPAQGVQIFTGRGTKIPCALQSKNPNINCNKFNTFKIGPYQKSLEKKSIDLICEGLYINGSSVLLHWSTSPLASTVCVFNQVRLCNPRDCSPPGPSFHGIFHGKTTGVGCHFLL